EDDEALGVYKDDQQTKPLLPAHKLATFFPESPVKQHEHIIVRPPPSEIAPVDEEREAVEMARTTTAPSKVSMDPDLFKDEQAQRHLQWPPSWKRRPTVRDLSCGLLN
ncbi:hypothetical protein AX14_004562, partial [Amanita brunnescens Koide BX004]